MTGKRYCSVIFYQLIKERYRKHWEQEAELNIDVFSDYSPRMKYWYSDGDKVPEIISFTQLLKWNYTEDYAAYICYAYMHSNSRIKTAEK